MRRLLLLLLLTGFFIPAITADAGAHQLSNASFLISNSKQPSDLNDNAWQKLTLPDLWQHKHADYGGTIWYRIALQMNELAKSLWGIYQPRVNMNAAVYINAIMVGSGGRFTQAMARNWNRPLYFTVPQSL